MMQFWPMKKRVPVVRLGGVATLTARDVRLLISLVINRSTIYLDNAEAKVQNSESCARCLVVLDSLLEQIEDSAITEVK